MSNILIALLLLITLIGGGGAGWVLRRWKYRSIDRAHYVELQQNEAEYGRAIRTLENERRSLQSELRRQDDQIDKLQQEVSIVGELRAKTDVLRVDYHEAVSARTQLEANFVASEERRNFLETSLASSEQVRQSLETNFTNAQQSLAALTAKHNATEQSRVKVQAAFRQSEQRLADLALRYKESETDRSGLSVALAESELNRDELVVGFAQSEQARELLVTNLARSEAARTDLTAGVQQSEKERVTLKADFDATVEELEALEEELEKSEQARAALKEKVAASERARAELAAELEVVEEDRGRIRVKLTAAEDAIEALESGADEQLESLKVELAGTRAELKARQAEAAELRQKLGRVEGELLTMQSQITQFEDELALAETTRIELDAARTDANNATDRVTARFEALGIDHRVTADQLASLTAQHQVVCVSLDEHRSALTSAKQHQAATQQQLEQTTNQVTTLQGRLESARAKHDKLHGDHELAVVELKRQRCSQEAALAELTTLRSQHETTVGRLDVASARAQKVERDATMAAQTSKARLSALEDERSEIRSQLSQVRSDLQAATTALAPLAATKAELAATHLEVRRLRDKHSACGPRIRSLDSALAKALAGPTKATSLGDLGSGDWHRGATKIGTPGADHTDDLKVINGIGPKIEELLNLDGIRSWEQIAALTPSQIKAVDAKLDEFPGRISRDKWVEQARHFIKHGHAPVALPARDAAGRLLVTDWRQGTTAVGIDGASHRDDLQVVRGIGPKMESILNTLGIRSWEQIASLTSTDIDKITEAIDTFPGRIVRDRWVEQASELVRRYPLTKPYARPVHDRENVRTA